MFKYLNINIQGYFTMCSTVPTVQKWKKISFCTQLQSKHKYVTHVFVAFLSKRNIDSLFKARTMLIPLRYAASQYAYQERAQYF